MQDENTAAEDAGETTRPPIRYLRLKDGLSWGCIGHVDDLATGATVTITTKKGEQRTEQLGPAVDLPDEDNLVIHTLDRGEQALDPATPHFIKNPETNKWDVAGLATEIAEDQTREIIRRDGSSSKITTGKRVHHDEDGGIVIHEVATFHQETSSIRFTRKHENEPWKLRVPIGQHKEGDTVEATTRKGGSTVILGKLLEEDAAAGVAYHAFEKPDPASLPPHFTRMKDDSRWLVSVTPGSFATGDRTKVNRARKPPRDLTLGKLVTTTDQGRALFEVAQYHDD